MEPVSFMTAGLLLSRQVTGRARQAGFWIALMAAVVAVMARVPVTECLAA